MKPKRTKSSYILVAGMMGLLIAGAWLTYTIYASLTKTQISPEQARAIRPLPGRIEAEAIENLAGRKKYSTAELSEIVVLNRSEASPSAEIEEASVGLPEESGEQP